MKRDISAEKGAIAIEFALIAPLLLLILLGIVEFGFALNQQQGLQAAAREGARLASVDTSTVAEVEARVTAALKGVTLDNSPVVLVLPGPCINRHGEQVTVTVTAAAEIDIPLWKEAFTWPMQGLGDFRCE
jgi:Flp pilus assembly pilin Flp